MKKLYFILIVAILAACSSADDNIPDSPVHAVTMEQTTLGLSVGGSQQLVATITPVNVKATQTWTSSSVGIASVSKDGIVTGVSAGVARITFRADDKTAVCTVKVGNTPATDIVVPDRMELTIGDAEVAVAYVLPETSVTTIKWSSSNDMIVSVAHDGTLKAWRTGNVIITATADDIEKLFPVSVILPQPKSITLDKTTHSMAPYDLLTLKATLLPAGTTSKITWTSSNTSVASVSGTSLSGSVFSSAIGTTTITATTANNLTASCVITVTDDTPPPAELTMSFANAAVLEFIDQPFEGVYETPLFSVAVAHIWESGVSVNAQGYYIGNGYVAELYFIIPRGASKVADGTYPFIGLTEILPGNAGADMSGNCIGGQYLKNEPHESFAWVYEIKNGVMTPAAPLKFTSSLKLTTTGQVTALSGTFMVWKGLEDPKQWFVDGQGNPIEEIPVNGSFTMRYPSPARSANVGYRPMSRRIGTNTTFKR